MYLLMPSLGKNIEPYFGIINRCTYVGCKTSLSTCFNRSLLECNVMIFAVMFLLFSLLFIMLFTTTTTTTWPFIPSKLE
jgi:hypothetical protein